MTSLVLEGKQGRYAFIADKPKSAGNRIICPKCNQQLVVYNGNYFCDDYPGGGAIIDCDWALAHPAETEADKRICDLLGFGYDE